MENQGYHSSIVYYASHNSLTHTNSCIAIAKQLLDVLFNLVTAEEIKFELPDNVKYHKIATNNCSVRINEKIALNKYPYVVGEPDINSYRDHVTQYINALHELKPNLVMVDLVSEMAILSKYLGYPTVFFYETIDNSALRVQLASQNADRVIVRYSKEFIEKVGDKPRDNMFFAGGVTKYDTDTNIKNLTFAESRQLVNIAESEKMVTYINGASVGTNDDAATYYQLIFETLSGLSGVKAMALFATESEQVIKFKAAYPNINFVIAAEEPFYYLKASDVVLSGGGMGVVMETCLANTPLITLPVPWIFDEQNRKAAALGSLGVSVNLESSSTNTSKLLNVLNDLLLNKKVAAEMRMAQRKIVDGHGYGRISKEIERILATEVSLKGISIEL